MPLLRREVRDLALRRSGERMALRHGPLRAAEARRHAGGQGGQRCDYEVLHPIALAGKHATVKVAGTAITAVLEWARIAEFRAEGSPVETVRAMLSDSSPRPSAGSGSRAG